MCTNDTVSRWTDSTTRTPLRRRSDVGDIIPRRLRVPHTAATINVASAPTSMTRDGPAGHHQEETTRHVRQDATTPAAPVGCAIPPPTTHSGSIVQPRERLSPGATRALQQAGVPSRRSLPAAVALVAGALAGGHLAAFLLAKNQP